MAETKTTPDRWMYATVPANIAAGPLGTFIPLYILAIGGGILDVAYAVTLFNTVAIPAAFLWGKLADYTKRKTLILASYISTTAMLALLYMDRNIFVAIALYGAMAFTISANATPLNMLVMETAEKEHWPRGFSKLQMLSGFGSVIGLAVSVIVSSYYVLSVLILALAAASFISIFMSIILIIEPAHAEIRRTSYFNYVRSFMKALVMVPTMILKMPIVAFRNSIDLRKIRKFGSGYAHYLYSAAFLFFFGSAIFNTEYAVGLNYHGLSKSSVFIIVLIGSAIQVIAYRYAHRMINSAKKNPVSSAVVAGRGFGYILIGVTFLVGIGMAAFFYANIVIYALAAGIAYAVYYTASYALLFSTLKGNNNGNMLGIYSAVSGIGTLVGSLASGIIAVSYGFEWVFISGGLLVAASGYVYSKL